MEFFTTNWYWFAMLAVSGILLAFPELMGGAGSRGMELNEVVRQMNHEKAVLIDVRDAAEFAAAHVSQAKHIGLNELQEKLPKTVKNKNLPVLFICQTGRNSISAVKQARQLGYENVHSVAGGMAAWGSANMPVVTASE